jgi:hypothetical protein
MFLYRINHPKNEINGGKLPFRGYILDHGFEVYEGKPERAVDLLSWVMERSGPAWVSDIDFMLGVFWGDSKGSMGSPAKMLDLYGYRLDRESVLPPDDDPGNPTAMPYVLKDGVWQCGRPIFCEDSFIMLGREGEHRRRHECLVDAMEAWPNLGELEPSETIELS